MSSQLPAVELVDTTKRFPGVVANDSISLQFFEGEVHCLLGENGAGKTTLMNMLSGIYQPDSGTIVVRGEPVEITSPSRGLELGIGMVHQHVTLAPSLTVLENLMLGDRQRIVLDPKAARNRMGDLMTLLGVDLDPDVKASSLALGQKQQVDIMRALWRGSRVLILDEPTSMLTPQGVGELSKVIQRLKDDAIAVIFITHKLHEAISMGDRVTILRRGRVVGQIPPDEVELKDPRRLHDTIIEMMFGAEASEVSSVAELAEDMSEVASHHRQRHIDTEPILRLDGVKVDGLEEGEVGLEGVDLTLRPGEILGIAGVDGNGQRALAEAVAGQRQLAAGDIIFSSESINGRSVEWRQHNGIRYVTDDAMGEGVVADFDVSLNLVAKRIGLPPFWNGRSLRFGKIEEVAEQLVEDYDIRAPSVHTRVGTLSGGNIRKTLLARELTSEPRVVVFNKPTHGLDVKTIAAVRARIREHAASGVGSILISTELEELLDLADRIAVLSKGVITGVVENTGDARLEEQIGRLMVGAD